ncbi:MAG: endonuclease/exonuclease/phosphatase family protein [Candidatus Microbacterium phytovorans]|uniref:Endonuclease/exonuclease/phosphatase family protein n=1 Tax=Candidatus Microbacterium phytovorans TaxID=3121374 RepID=A0AAJ5W5M6_9MICO|nr:endonuclease/exonuclease/phosphatase family protein [Microbacterium sp.]WEK14685.1 MAG: endonuclease/exonuclease/phosphatase family protein [Microbacterium sp.]
MLRLLGILVTVAFAISAAIVTWPQFFRLERAFPFAQIVSLRGPLVLAFGLVALLALLLCLARTARGFAVSVLIVALVASGANAAIMLARGTGAATLPSKTDGSLRVMTWNTAGAATDPAIIARTAVAMQADIVALPETTIETGEDVAVAMREMGHPMWAHHEDFGDREDYPDWDANSTTLLISPDLGDYAVVESSSDGTTNTSAVPSVVAMPVEGEGPIVVAVHAVAPRQNAMDAWRSDLQWIADQCAADDVILAGDFNATVDHMDRLGTDGGTLGRCHDATSETGNGAVGTWSTTWPSLLGTPIDHVMATDRWKPVASVVLGTLDDAGSDHRPVIVQFERAGAD